jgi:uncharacterized protein YjbI with pentapeptide repeats
LPSSTKHGCSKLKGADLTNKSFKGAQLGGADLTGVTFIGSDFDGAEIERETEAYKSRREGPGWTMPH